MADIKVREVNRGHIKTLDRAESAMHHLKESSVRTRSYDLQGRQEDDPNDYAQDRMEHYAGDSAAFAARAGIEMLHHSDTDKGSDMESSVQQAFREQSIKNIQESHEKTRMTDAEVQRNTERQDHNGRIARSSGGRSREMGRPKKREDQPAKYGATKRSEMIERQKKEYMIRNLRRDSYTTGDKGRLLARGIIRTDEKVPGHMGRILRDLAERSRIFFRSLTAGSVAAVAIVLIMTLCSASFSLLGDDNGDPFDLSIYDLGGGDSAIVQVAKAQIGNVGGEKYWRWYGFTSHVHWCACFVSWCGDQCGYIRSGIIPKFSVVGNGADWFREEHRWAGRDYSPRPGDIIFFDFESNGVLDHVGIVEMCDGKTVTTIEGNSNNACRRLTYRAGSGVIAGYGVPEYPSDMSTDKACIWADRIARDDSYHYVHWNQGDVRTQECPVCNNHPDGNYKGWNCIGFAFACWRHGAGLSCNCSCDVINNSEWDQLLAYSSDKEASSFASGKVGVPCIVIRNDGNAIPISMLKRGDIICLYEGDTSYHVILYEGNGKYADCVSVGDNITAHNIMDAAFRSEAKVAIRYLR